MAVHLNPLTSGVLTEAGNGETLRLTSFAPGRSFRPLFIERAKQPAAVDLLLSWLAGKAVTELPSAGLGFYSAATSTGLFLSDRELSAIPPHAKPELGEGRRTAALLCPEIEHFLAHDLIVPELAPSLADDLADKGFAELPALLDPAGLAAVRAFYRTLADGGWMHPDSGPSKRQVIHNDPVGRHVMHGLTPLIAQLAREQVKPSYCFAAEYGPGSELPRHIDREQCEYSVSLFLDHRPGEPGDPSPWPLVIHTPAGDVEARQPAGGGPVFRGRELPHSRAPLGEGQRSQMLFVHYVPADFSGSLD